MMACVAGVVAVMWQGLGQVREGLRRLIAVLPFQAGIVDGAAVEPGRRAGLEAAQGEAQTMQRLRE